MPNLTEMKVGALSLVLGFVLLAAYAIVGWWSGSALGDVPEVLTRDALYTVEFWSWTLLWPIRLLFVKWSGLHLMIALYLIYRLIRRFVLWNWDKS